MKKYIRHGDIPFYETNKIEGKLQKHNGSFVLAEGETTGHYHIITVPKIEDMDVRKTSDDGFVLTLREEGILTHPEHKKLVVPKGTYYVGKEREVDHFNQTIRKVID